MPEKRRTAGSPAPSGPEPLVDTPITHADIQFIQDELTRLRGQVQGHTEILERFGEVFASLREMEQTLQRHSRTSQDRATRLTAQVEGVLASIAQIKETVAQLGANRTELREEILRRQDDQLARVIARLDDDVARSVARATSMTLEQLDGRITGLTSAIEGKFAGLDGVLTKKFQDSADALKRELAEDRRREAGERREAEVARRTTEEEARKREAADSKAREEEVEERRKAEMKEIKETIAARPVVVGPPGAQPSDWRISIDPTSARALGAGLVLTVFSLLGTAGFLDSCMDRKTMENVKDDIREQIEADIQSTAAPTTVTPPAKPRTVAPAPTPPASPEPAPAPASTEPTPPVGTESTPGRSPSPLP